MRFQTGTKSPCKQNRPIWNLSRMCIKEFTHAHLQIQNGKSEFARTKFLSLCKHCPEWSCERYDLNILPCLLLSTISLYIKRFFQNAMANQQKSDSSLSAHKRFLDRKSSSSRLGMRFVFKSFFWFLLFCVFCSATVLCLYRSI